MRRILRITIAAGGRWPEGQSTPAQPPGRYTWIRIHNRTPAAAPADVVFSPFEPPDNDAFRYWDLIPSGSRKVRNVGRLDPHDAHTATEFVEEVHFLNLSAVNAANLWVELDTEPIVDFEAALLGGGGNTSPANVSIQDGSGGAAKAYVVNNAADGQAGGNVGLLTAADMYLFNGATWDRMRSAGLGVLSVGDTSSFNVESTAALAGAATFTGPWRDCLNSNWFGALALADVAGTLIIDEADAATPNVANLVSSQASAAVPANQPSPPATTGQVARIAPTKALLRFLRVRYINGATIQARFNLQSSLSPLN